MNDQTYPVDAALMLESMTQSLLMTSTDLDEPGPHIEYVNKAFERMTGWRRSEILGGNPRILQGPKTDKRVFDDMREKLHEGKIWSGRTINYKKDGSTFYMQWSIAPVFGQDGKIQHFLAVQEDVSDIVAVEKALEEARMEEEKRIRQIEAANIKLHNLTQRQKKTLDLFIKYVPEPIVKKTLSEPPGIILAGDQLDVAVMFCDTRKFTTIAEALKPTEVVRVLNVYYSMMSEVIKRHNGVINQFVGDEIFVSFGAPDPIHNPEEASVLCALEMINKLDEISSTLSDILKEKLIVGIGINYGPVIAGNLGSEDRLSYSITGDTVNTAKRIETLAKEIPNAIVISESVYRKTTHIVNTRPMGNIKVKGKNIKVNVYQVTNKA